MQNVHTKSDNQILTSKSDIYFDLFNSQTFIPFQFMYMIFNFTILRIGGGASAFFPYFGLLLYLA